MVNRISGRLLLVVICAFLSRIGSCYTHFSVKVTDAKADLRGTFAAWAEHNGKHYQPGTAEWERRYIAWLGNFERAAAGGKEAVLLNGLQDLSLEEFRTGFLGHTEREASHLRGLQSNGEWIYDDVEDFPKSVDWREKGVVGPIKNQHANGTPCGCCWAFAAIGVTECIYSFVAGKTVSLSEQQLIDCDRGPPWYDLGCDGGDFEGGIEYVVENGGIDLEEDYPYIGKDDSCKWKKQETKKYGAIDGYMNVPRSNFTAFTQAVVMHPVATAICCGPFLDYWHAYTGGIMELEGHPEACHKPLDHAVTVIGYGKEDGKPFWLVKNSWGDKWGENGFFRIPRLMDSPLGWGGFHTAPGFPLKRGLNPAVDAYLDKQAAVGTA